MMNFSGLFLAAAMFFSPLVNAGTIKFCATINKEGETCNGDRARIDCYDYDPGNADDYMAGGYLDSNGCISLNYATTTTSVFSCSEWWDSCANTSPDIYCQVSGDCLQPYTTETKNGQNQAGTTDFGRRTIYANENYCGNPGYNGCGAASFPQWLSEAASQVSGFRNECNDHDVCYADCSKTRSYCDTVFRDDMYARAGSGKFRRLLAYLFYKAVSLGGRGACRAGRSGSTCLARCDQ